MKYLMRDTSDSQRKNGIGHEDRTSKMHLNLRYIRELWQILLESQIKLQFSVKHPTSSRLRVTSFVFSGIFLSFWICQESDANIFQLTKSYTLSLLSMSQNDVIFVCNCRSWNIHLVLHSVHSIWSQRLFEHFQSALTLNTPNTLRFALNIVVTTKKKNHLWNTHNS